jgi:transcriptional regulator with AAA-type ATPase domain
LLGRAGIRFAFGAASAPLDSDEPDGLRERALCELEGEPVPEEDPIQIDPVMGRLFGLAERLGQGGAPVHLLGEPGVGKEVLARAIHQRGVFAAGPFVRVDCAGAGGGALERAVAEASYGTLFLRGVERLGQGGVPREVPEGQLITSSRTGLETGAASVLHLPPLRERPTESPALAESYLARYARTLGRERRVLSPTARRLVLGEAGAPGLKDQILSSQPKR